MTDAASTGDHVRDNRASWEHDSAGYQERNAAQLNRWDRLGWGVYDAPEDEVGALGDVAGLDALEFGCGACQFGIKVAMRGARVTGLDFSHAQLRQGLANMEESGVRFPVVEADGEQTPFREGSFDLVFCDHGVMGFADPFVTVPEVARLLRPGGWFVFNNTTPFIWTVWADDDEDAPAGTELKRSYFGPRRWDHEEDGERWDPAVPRARLLDRGPDRAPAGGGHGVHHVRGVRPDRVGSPVPGRADLEGSEDVNAGRGH